MTAETIALIASTLAGITAAVKAIAEARKARFEAQARIEAEKTTDAIILGVENAKRTLGEANLAQYLTDEIKSAAANTGVEEKLNKRVKQVKSTAHFDRSRLMKKLDEE